MVSVDTPGINVFSQYDWDFNVNRESSHQILILPFVKCQVSDVEAKALVSTCSKKSFLSKPMFNMLRLPESRLPNINMSVIFQEQRYDHRFEVRDDIPDLVLGLDFLIAFKCAVNFKDFTLCLDSGSNEVPFMEKSEIPLKFRVHRNLAASF